jgi:hypothetical protein
MITSVHHVEYCRYYCGGQILMKLEISRQIFEKYFNIKFYENPSNGSRVVPCGRAGGRTDMTYLVVASRNFANGFKNQSVNAV